MSLQGIKVGDEVIVNDGDGRLLAIAECVRVTATQATLKWSVGVMPRGSYLIKSGKEVGGNRVAVFGNIDVANRELADRQEADELAKEEKRQRDYDALPEKTKLARAVRGFFDISTEEVVAAMPLELLRRLAKWIDEQ